MKANKNEFIYQGSFKGTINDFLLKQGFSTNNIYYLLGEGHVLVNGRKINDRNYTFDEGKQIVFVKLLDEVCNVITTDKPINIVYEDDYLLIVDKPADLDVEPTMANNEETLANYVANYYKQKDIKSNIHLVNRLDKATSGLVILAKNQYIHNLLNDAKIIKKYQAVVEGKVKKGTIKIKISKDDNSIKRVIDPNGKECITKYKLIKFDGTNSLVDIEILTGRTHQIRLSFASINHPLVGDKLYNSNYVEGTNMFLRAYNLQFVHPISNKKINIAI